MTPPVQTKEDVIERLGEARQALADLGVTEIGLFGSFVSRRQTETSDVDMLIYFASGKNTFDNFMDLSFLLEELMGRHVELVTPQALSPHIGPHILREVERVRIAA